MADTPPIKMDALTDDQKALVGTLVAAQVKTALDSFGTKISTDIAGVIDGKLKGFGDQIEAKIAEVRTAAAPAGKPEDKKTTDANEPPAWAKGLMDQVTAMVTKDKAKDEAETRTAMVNRVAATKFPNHKLIEQIKRGAIAAGVKDEAAFEAWVKDFEEAKKAEFTALGLKFEGFTADPAAEGAKDQKPAAAGSDAELKEKEKKGIEAVRKAPRVGALA